MKRPVFGRALSDEEREALVAGLRSPDAFVLRRCGVPSGPRLAAARGKIARAIAADLGGDGQTVRTASAAFNTKGLACLARWSSRPHPTHPAFDADQAERLKALLHQSPRAFGPPPSGWTLPLAAAVSFAPGLTQERVSGETVRAPLARLGVRGKRVKEWHPEGTRSPDPASARNKGRNERGRSPPLDAIACAASCGPIPPGRWAARTRPGGAGRRGRSCTPGPPPTSPGA
jgi:hypothetical protein